MCMEAHPLPDWDASRKFRRTTKSIILLPAGNITHVNEFKTWTVTILLELPKDNMYGIDKHRIKCTHRKVGQGCKRNSKLQYYYSRINPTFLDTYKEVTGCA